MSTGGTGGHPIRGLNYGATAGQQNVDLSDDPDPKGTAAGYVSIIHSSHFNERIKTNKNITK